MSYQDRIAVPVKSAVGSGKYIVISPNFPMIDDSHQPNIRMQREASGLGDAFSQASAKWRQTHQHILLQPSSLDGVAEIISAFRAFHEERGSHPIPLDKIKISASRVLSHWGNFFPKTSGVFNASSQNVETSRLHMGNVLSAVLANCDRQPERDRVPGLHPVLRTGLSVPVELTEKLKRRDHVLTGCAWHMDVRFRHDDQKQVVLKNLRVQEVLRVKDTALRGEIKDAENFKFMAIPFLERWNLASVLKSGGAYPINLFYDISHESQVVTEGRRGLVLPETAQAELQL